MNKERFSVEQIVAVLKEHELGLTVEEIVRQGGSTQQTSRDSTSK